MRTLITILMVLFILPQAKAQFNLIPNPSFEDTLNCDSFTYYPNVGFPWFSPTNCTPDYYYGLNPTCGNSAFQNQSGYQLPYDGIAYVGIFVAVPITGNIATREYISVLLLDTLNSGKEYYLEFFVSRANQFYLATDDIGAHLSSQLPLNTGCSYLPYLPQVENPQGNIITDSLNWTQVSGIFTATGGEKYLTIGNFKDSINTTIIDADNGNGEYNNAKYYIDKVSLIPLDSLQSIYNDSFAQKLFEVYPTVLQQGSLIRVYSKLNFESNFEIITLDGKYICKGEILSGENYIASSIFSPGIYVLIINTEKGFLLKKLIVY